MRGIVVNQGMGNFLCPPGHPSHAYCIETDLRRRPENRSRCSLETAAECEWLDAKTVNTARKLLDDWRPLSQESDEVQAWILQILGYFRNCYCCGDGTKPEDWHARNLVIAKSGPVDKHAGVHLIRKYYPEFVPSDEHFENARWGEAS